MKTHLAAVMLLALSSLSYGADQCNLQKFPDFWADAQDHIKVLNKKLNEIEWENKFSISTQSSFRKSLKLCAAKHASTWGNDRGSGSAGVVSQMKCEALLICSRIDAIQSKW